MSRLSSSRWASENWFALSPVASAISLMSLSVRNGGSISQQFGPRHCLHTAKLKGDSGWDAWAPEIFTSFGIAKLNVAVKRSQRQEHKTQLPNKKPMERLNALIRILALNKAAKMGFELAPVCRHIEPLPVQ